MSKTIATFETHCFDCDEIFDSPHLSDFSYGELNFCSHDGTVYAYCNCFERDPEIIETLFSENVGPELYQFALAELADPISGKMLSNKYHCPKCGSSNLGHFVTKKTGVRKIESVSYSQFLLMKKEEQYQRIQILLKNWQKKKNNDF